MKGYCSRVVALACNPLINPLGFVALVGVLTPSGTTQDKVTTLRKRADIEAKNLMQIYTSEPHLSASLQA
eukprot:3224807-Pyramimonas_sp.AAC.1